MRGTRLDRTMRTVRQAVLMLFGVALICGRTTYAQDSFALVEGRVTCNDGNVPARGATVQLVPLDTLLPNASQGEGSSKNSASAKSDFFGVYSIASVAPGTYVVNATMEGYEDDLKRVRATLKRYTPGEQKSVLGTLPQIEVKVNGSVHQDLIIRRAGAIFGKVLADAGGPISQSRVTATLIFDDVSSGTAGATPADVSAFTQSVVTDDRGVYRVAGLPSGSYRVSVRMSESFFGTKLGGPQQVSVFPQRTGIADLTVFAPQALKASEARVIKVRDGDEIGDATWFKLNFLGLHFLTGTTASMPKPIAWGKKLAQGQSPFSFTEAMSPIC